MTAPAAVTGAPQAPDVPGIPNPQLSIKLAFGDDYPEPPQPNAPPDKAKAIGYLNRLIQETQADAMIRYRTAVTCSLYYAGKHWFTWNNRSRECEELPLEEHEFRVTYNLTRPIIRSRIQRLLSPKVAFSAMPRSNAMDERDKARTAENWLNAAWRRQKMDDLMTAGMQLASTGGIAVLKSYWNNATGPLRTAEMQMPRMEPVIDEMGPVVDPETGEPAQRQVIDPVTQQPVFDTVPVNAAGQPVPDPKLAYRYRPGDTGTGLRSVFNVRTNPDARGWTPEEGLRWIIDEEMVPVTVARRRWPEYANEIKPFGSLPALTYERMSSGAQTARAISSAPHPSTGTSGKEEMTLQREYWQLPDDDYFPQGRLIVQIGECAVFDGPFPQDAFPFDPIVDEPGLLSANGRPTIIDLVPLQDTLNRECTAAVQEMYESGIGQFAAFDIPGLEEQLTREPRAVIKIPKTAMMHGRGLKDVFMRMDPAHVGADRWRIIDMTKQAMFDVGAFHEITRGSTPPGVDSGVAIAQLVEQEKGQLAIAFRSLKNTIISWGRTQLKIAKWGYGDDEERFIPVNRPDLGFQIEGVKGVDMPDAETIDLDLDNFKPQSEAEKRAELMDALDRQIVDPRAALKALDVGTGMNALLDSHSRHYARARMENLKIQRGKYIAQPGEPDPATGMPGPTVLINEDGTPFFLGTHDDHEIHLLVHQEIILDDFRPVEEKQLAQAHAALHQQAIAMIQAQAAMAAAQQGQPKSESQPGAPGDQGPPPPQ